MLNPGPLNEEEKRKVHFSKNGKAKYRETQSAREREMLMTSSDATCSEENSSSPAERSEESCIL